MTHLENKYHTVLWIDVRLYKTYAAYKRIFTIKSREVNLCSMQLMFYRNPQ